MTIKSHPDKYLYTHLNETALNAAGIISGSPIEFRVAPKKILEDLAYIEGAFHDFGKATKYFQEYLISGGRKITGPKNHALLSALLARSIASTYLADKEIGNFEKKLMPFFIFTSVRRHHGNLNNFTEELSDIEVKKDELIKQALSLIRPETDELVKKLLLPLDIQFNFDAFVNGISNDIFLGDFNNFNLEVMSFGEYDALSTEMKIELFYLHELMYSVLLQSDKSDVILEKKVNYSKQRDNLNNYRRNKNYDNPSKEIDRLKNKAFNSAIDNIKKVFNKDKHLYSITLPTGLGKTITSFAVVSVIKEILGEVNSRIIITIPFTSIIDQNYEVYSEILDRPDSTQLLKHHHLSEPAYKYGNEELSYDQAQFLIESWDSQIIVTTFVQLLECFFSCDKSKLLKLPNICGSIIILDEVQSINYEYWSLIREAFQVIGRTYGCYFVFMSATQPLIFDPAKEIIEIIPDYKEYFGLFNRTKITFLSKKDILIDDLVSEIYRYMEENIEDNVLIILNTKKAVKDCFEKLKYSLDTNETDIYFLTTLITPYERKKILREIKERKSSKRYIIVSTQLIEAGVDISVQAVFREIAPLDSIIQAGGRANRYAEREIPCKVFLFVLSENFKNTNRIYGLELIKKTQIVLQDYVQDGIEEKDYLKMIERYFREVRLQSEVIISRPMENICKLDFANVNEFKLIPESRSECVYISLNDKASEIWNDFVRIYSNSETDIFRKRQDFSKIKSDFYDFVINVPIPYKQNQINIDSEKIYGFYYIDPRAGSNFYTYDSSNFSENTGYHSDETIFITG